MGVGPKDARVDKPAPRGGVEFTSGSDTGRNLFDHAELLDNMTKINTVAEALLVRSRLRNLQ